MTKTFHRFTESYVISYCGYTYPFALRTEQQNINNVSQVGSSRLPPPLVIWMSAQRKQENKPEVAANYWVTHHVSEKVYSWEWRWSVLNSPSVMLLRREATVTLSGIAQTIQPGYSSSRHVDVWKVLQKYSQGEGGAHKESGGEGSASWKKSSCDINALSVNLHNGSKGKISA